MGMQTFEHIAVQSLEEATSLLDVEKGKAVAIAGGTDILGILKDEVHAENPAFLVDLKTIKGLDHIIHDANGITVGTLTKLSDLAKDKTVREKLPLLAKAAHAVASPQIRNMGTVGGNICQEPRCWYYRNYENTFHCLRKGGQKCPALTGENRFHSIFGSVPVGKPGCSASCPDSVDIPLYMEKIRIGEIEEASRIILEKNPMPAITGRICPHFCEQGCNRGEIDSAVSIRSIERHIGDFILENQETWKKESIQENGRSVAVIGGGPAGLSCAYYLRLKGFTVTIFEKQPKLGGMLRYGIPEFRLSGKIMDRQIEFLVSTGIRVSTSQVLGKDFTLDSLKHEGFEAIFLAVGSWVPKSLGIEGEQHRNVLSGIYFLEAVKRTGSPNLKGTVAVIGGGNTAIDAARTALRCGAKHVALLYRRTQNEMPSEAEEIEDAKREGVELHFLTSPKKAVLEGNTLVGLQCCKMQLGDLDASGRRRPIEIPGSEFLFKADWVIAAIGQDQNLKGLEALKPTKGNGIEVNPLTMETSIERIYAGGDIVSGPATAVEAIAAGRLASHAIEASLLKEKKAMVSPTAQILRPELREINREAFTTSPRITVEEIAVSNRSLKKEDYQTIGREKIELEAHRCFDCSCVAVNASDLAPALIALKAMIKTTKRNIPAEDFFSAALMKTTVLADDELVQEIFIPLPKENSRGSFEKFRIRNSIDFPIVSVAAVITCKDDVITEARVVLGAVAPIPVRASKVEKMLIGKKITEATAAMAGKIIGKEAFPLACNRYKVQIAQELTRKAILGV
ncbi:NADPH-dependent glutamate synthase beta chain-like oxidoreductase [Sphaerochaeta pleomorpha str. Grapes]|uniref:NADPH-dependent glutamate synthase beta chain-like oxidoreductase n=1 Tax=Sphaerochaeta pleomorpha (strain ATCC BAA-1885 / DSM 22778 / Grapes) TaxID=158190 RepID=G8QZ09_SPHPG|nr:FAD-dependent oxidoreductase [Sphaerochaeta pleomorpha]AEV30868.1 NADPH-dependent glutamate synthase beta chain-like oxidoreductase [Sphaerochaeta pleomorpha str. Grapes]